MLRKEAGMREKLAELMYEFWGDQMRHVFLHCDKGDDGPIIPWVLFDQWDRQITHTPFYRLSDEKREGCQRQADKVLALLNENFEKPLMLQGHSYPPCPLGDVLAAEERQGRMVAVAIEHDGGWAVSSGVKE